MVIAGTGFAATFFLYRILQSAPANMRIVVLERGRLIEHSSRLARRGDKEFDPEQYFKRTGDPDKSWAFSLGFGGSSNCWWGTTPRMIPSDFELKTRYGHGADWPFSYDDLEPFYCEAEDLMQISGSAYPQAPRSRPYPLPPHGPTGADVILAKAWPGQHVPMPTARASRPTSTRGQCCSNGVCTLCPVDAKFTILNGMRDVYDDPRVSLFMETEVRRVETEGGRAHAFEWRTADGKLGSIAADHLVLATNAMFNADILMRSGDASPLTGKRLHEQVGITAQLYLDGVDCFQGSTAVTGMGLMLWDNDERRKEMAAVKFKTDNYGFMRPEPGRWRQVLPIRMVYEDLPQDRNRIIPATGDDERPTAEFVGRSAYTQRAIDRMADDIAKICAELPVEDIIYDPPAPSESHIQGTTVMGHDPADSVTDQDGLHHRWRDLRVLGSSLFPTGSPANPTLTLSAHALRAASRMEWT